MNDDVNLNTGSELINYSGDDAAKKQYTIVVSGLGRSGTSMLAKMIAAGGVPMGPSNNPIHEDIGISTLIEDKKKWALRREISLRNKKYNVWGFKRPLIVRHHKLLDSTLRNPRYVIIFRDPLAFASRVKLSRGLTIRRGLKMYRNQSEIIIDFVQKSESPILLLSYEKTLGNPEKAVDTLQRFCGIEMGRRPDMVNQIRPNDNDYRARTTRKNSQD
ncbi:sulfotransferase [uncultured Aliiroseovarius sp.]|uniref:sulfotransferase n=1 Tax=uncultured Aliiroseovarius sp. TaxID=1658783 RepID=UPI002591D47B|nr:sulfotransferase [uncultured Aliiroseovarius sp.]